MLSSRTITLRLLRSYGPIGLACLVAMACNVTSLAPAVPTDTLVAPTLVPENASVLPTASPVLATPVAQEPAAGICAGFDGPVVEFHIEPGIPDPRCAHVRADQTLRVVNKTDAAVDVMIGAYQAHLEPGGEYSIDEPFGDYLAPGVHLLQVLPCCGPTIVLDISAP